MTMFKISEKLEYNSTMERYEVGLEAKGGEHLLWQPAYAESMEDARSLAYLALYSRINALKDNHE